LSTNIRLYPAKYILEQDKLIAALNPFDTKEELLMRADEIHMKLHFEAKQLLAAKASAAQEALAMKAAAEKERINYLIAKRAAVKSSYIMQSSASAKAKIMEDYWNFCDQHQVTDDGILKLIAKKASDDEYDIQMCVMRKKGLAERFARSRTDQERTAINVEWETYKQKFAKTPEILRAAEARYGNYKPIFTPSPTRGMHIPKDYK